MEERKREGERERGRENGRGSATARRITANFPKGVPPHERRKIDECGRPGPDTLPGRTAQQVLDILTQE